MTAPRYTYRRYLDDTWADEQRRRNGQVTRDPWCVTALMRVGSITPGQHGAAVRLAKLMERAAGQTASGGLGEAIDGGGRDPHARMFDASLCAREAECALAYARTNMPAPAGVRLAVLDTALSFPHRSVSDAQRDAGLGYGGRARQAFVDHLVIGLDLLQTYFDAVDAQAERERRRNA